MMSAMNTQTITPNTARKREAAAAAAADKPVRDHTLALTLSYNGAPFSGFARQPGQTTVQGDLEDALRMLFRRDVETTCAGRTDAGVHALGQVRRFPCLLCCCSASFPYLCRLSCLNSLQKLSEGGTDKGQEKSAFSLVYHLK